MEEIVVDGRGLVPPEPMERVMDALDALELGQRLRFLIHREPIPLYGLLQRYHYRYQTIACEDGTFEIVIESP